MYERGLMDESFSFETLRESSLSQIVKKESSLYKLNNACLYLGYYLFKSGVIFTDTLHEGFSSSWLSYWYQTRSTTYGGPESDHFLIDKSLKYLKPLKSFSRKQRIHEPVFLFQYNYDCNFHHFLVSSLPKLSALRDCGFDLKILVRRNTPKYQIDFVSLVVGESSLLLIEDDVLYTFDEIYCTPFPQDLNCRPIFDFYNSISCEVASDSLVSPKLAYLNRDRESDKRPMSNVANLNRLLRTYRFHSISPSDYSLLQRFSLLSQSVVVLSEFGAGCANVLFARACKFLIVLEHPKYKLHWEYEAFCQHKNIRIIKVPSSLVSSIKFGILQLVFTCKGRSFVNPFNSLGWKTSILILRFQLLKLRSVLRSCI